MKNLILTLTCLVLSAPVFAAVGELSTKCGCIASESRTVDSIDTSSSETVNSTNALAQ